MMYNPAARRRTAIAISTQRSQMHTSQLVVIPGPDSRKGRKGDLRSREGLPCLEIGGRAASTTDIYCLLSIIYYPSPCIHDPI
ncbi:hypothetical protein I7I53_07479 [Histoplasma capsulatum var. duboisii H88]|uniref:Uncharacterized protein n=1 Tax=Ajellomyces capsulatus (strain H88) TaxID=544711 RepID=A0A8A1LJ29_AJEC8|nr:hypothetical protein I7I53_07479 [Histoplasma capsulatum var. duboisii H88]